MSEYEIFWENYFSAKCIEFSFIAAIWFAQLGVLS